MYARAQHTDGEVVQGRIVDLQSAGEHGGTGDQADVGNSAKTEEANEATQLWIGVSLRSITSPALRTHLQLADDLGVLVDSVVPNSPADRAGLRRHDVLIAVNSEAVTNATVLQDAVLSSGAQEIELDVIRLAKETSVLVTPEAMPIEIRQQMQQPRSRNPQLGQRLGDMLGNLEGLPGLDAEVLDRLRRGPNEEGNLQVNPLRRWGGNLPGLDALPGGISVKMSRSDDNAVRIEVQRGDDSWTIDGDDQQSLAQLPEDVRPLVERLLRQPQHDGVRLGPFWQQLHQEGAWEQLMPENLGQFGKDELHERMNQLEQQMESLREQLQDN